MHTDANLSKHIQKSFRYLNESRVRWLDILASSRCHADSLINLGEQLQCCHLVNIPVTPLSDFPDVSILLQYKLTNLMQSHLEKLLENLNLLEGFVEKISVNQQTAMDMYLRHRDRLPVSEVVRREVLCPSLADTLDWLSQMDTEWHTYLSTLKYLSVNVNLNDMKSLQDLQKNWKMDKDLVNRMESIWCRLHYFMEETF